MARSDAVTTRQAAFHAVPVEVVRASSPEIAELRELYRAEMNAQIVHDSYHARGYLDSYLIRVDGDVVGYGCVGGYREMPRVTLKEFYLVPGQRADALSVFRQVVAASNATRIEVQTNDRLLTQMFYEAVDHFTREKILFNEGSTTDMSIPGARFRRAIDADVARMFIHTMEPVGEWLVEVDEQIVATGGIMHHYNPPFGDIYMEVAEPFRRRGFGSFLVQELKRACRDMGRVPAARCNVSNEASRATLQKAGMTPCALVLSGAITS